VQACWCPPALFLCNLLCNAECRMQELPSCLSYSLHYDIAISHPVPSTIFLATAFGAQQIDSLLLLRLTWLLFSAVIMPADAKKRKPRISGTPYVRKPGPKGPCAPKDAPKTSAEPAKSTKRKNLTLHDWLDTVFPYVDANPDTAHTKIATHFATLPNGALKFDATTLGRKLDMQAQLEARAASFPGTLSSKRPRVVTRPDVELRLKLWFESMMARGEHVSGEMLKSKRHRLEVGLEVPEDERLSGDGWVAPFLRA
jgi:hypothetical protein